MNKIEPQYKLINSKTKEETICNKVVIDGFDYYASSDKISINDPITDNYRVWFWRDDCSLLGRKKVLATNNPNIDINKIIDNIEALSIKECNPDYGRFGEELEYVERQFWKKGYNKSQETSPFSDDDIISYRKFWVSQNIEWYDDTELGEVYINKKGKKITEKELLDIWKEKRIKTIYYVDKNN